MLYALLAVHLDDEDCSAACVCAQLDFVCTDVGVEVLLSDDLAHGVHEHSRTASSSVGIEHCRDGALSDVQAETRCLGGDCLDGGGAGTGDGDDLARSGAFGRGLLVKVVNHFGRAVSLDALDVVNRNGAGNLRAVKVEADGVC